MNSILNLILTFLQSLWTMTGEMAPYLLFGFLIAGLLHVFIRQEFVERHLGRRGFRQILKATLIGVPMPLCSCGTIPVAAALRRDGASKGATAAFLASTPQIGVNSVFATWGMLGGVFTIIRVAAAFCSGLLAGVFTDLFDHDSRDQTPKPPAAPDADRPGLHINLRRALEYGFVTLPADIGRALILGLLVAGAIAAFIPADLFAGRLGDSLLLFPLITLVAIPMYTCSTGSIPVALALMHLGVSPGAALVFLIAGPATSAAAISTLWKMVGRRTALIYLASIVLTSWGFGFLFNTLPMDVLESVACHAQASSSAAIQGHIWAGLLVLVLLNALRPHAGKSTCEACAEIDRPTRRYTIRGMRCSHCAEQIRRVLFTVPGVEKAEVNHLEGAAIVSGNQIPDDHLLAEVRKLGYEIVRESSQK